MVLQDPWYSFWPMRNACIVSVHDMLLADTRHRLHKGEVPWLKLLSSVNSFMRMNCSIKPNAHQAVRKGHPGQAHAHSAPDRT
eukprot:scaffold160811_cov16-Tisochrysis_lutea.AAC.1